MKEKLTDRQLVDLVVHSRIGRRNSHARAVGQDAAAALAGSTACAEACAEHWASATHPNQTGVVRYARAADDRARWRAQLLCGHDVWVSSRVGTRAPADRYMVCPSCGAP